MKNAITLVAGMLVFGGFAICGAASPESPFEYGLYIHYGPRTFLRQGEKGPLPPDRFTPPASLDVRTWAKTAKESGMTFAILTAKHEDGFCLWPAKDDGYSVSGSPGKRDLVGEFVSACQAEGIAPGVHYSFPDTHNWEAGGKKVSAAYFSVISRHFDDLLSRYTDLKVLCLDGSAMLSASQLAELKSIIGKRNRSCIVWDNWGVQGSGHFIGTTIKGWFWQPRYQVTSIQRILNEMESARQKGKAYVLNVGPAPDGRIPDDQVVLLGAVRAKAPQPSQTAVAESGKGTTLQAQPTPPGHWVNSLGMKFVPVPGTTVKFSIWVTRVQDFEAFVTASGRKWRKPKFEQRPMHPAVLISWDDAKAFCEWLTVKERKDGVISPNEFYRLPTDLEYSLAVGLENEKGGTPKERSRKIPEVFPWGKQWPRPNNIGNYNKTHRDPYEFTSPVDAFSPNRLGLHDMGGNVLQWCEDTYDPAIPDERTKRSSGFWYDNRDNLWSSTRFHGTRSSVNRDTGFRCVLATKDGVAPSTVLAAQIKQAKPVPAAAGEVPSEGAPLKVLSQQVPNIMEWALAPLDQAVPGGIRQNLMLLREDLLDEAKAKPTAAPMAYDLGRRLCDALVSVFDERDATLVKTGYRAAQADANSEVTSQALEARRNHMMSWPQYAREKDQAAEIFRQQMNRAALTKELPKVEWAKRTAILRKGLDSLYSKYRDALR